MSADMRNGHQGQAKTCLVRCCTAALITIAAAVAMFSVWALYPRRVEAISPRGDARGWVTYNMLGVTRIGITDVRSGRSYAVARWGSGLPDWYTERRVIWEPSGRGFLYVARLWTLEDWPRALCAWAFERTDTAPYARRVDGFTTPWAMEWAAGLGERTPMF